MSAVPTTSGGVSLRWTVSLFPREMVRKWSARKDLLSSGSKSVQMIVAFAAVIVSVGQPFTLVSEVRLGEQVQHRDRVTEQPPGFGHRIDPDRAPEEV